MKTTIIRNIAIVALSALSVSALPAFAQEETQRAPGFSDFDLDNNKKISYSEAKLNQWLADNFTVIDEDKDGEISAAEFAKSVK